MNDDHSGAIWVLGLLLVFAVAVESPYWQQVAHAYASGNVPKNAGTGSVFTSGSGLMMTAGAFVLVLVLAGIAQISPNAGAFSIVLLLGLWMLFLVSHTGLVSGFLGHFIPTQGG